MASRWGFGSPLMTAVHKSQRSILLSHPHHPGEGLRRYDCLLQLLRPYVCSIKGMKDHATHSPSNRFPSKLTNVFKYQARSIIRLRQSQFCTYRMQKLQFLEDISEVLEECRERGCFNCFNPLLQYLCSKCYFLRVQI